jgi:hypothetical protein
MATGVDIDKHLFNSLHRLIALIEPGAGSNFERPLLSAIAPLYSAAACGDRGSG